MKKYTYTVMVLMISAQMVVASQYEPENQLGALETSGTSCISSGSAKEILDDTRYKGEKVSCIDINFDGKLDILIEHPPTGQIKLSSVFIFDQNEKKFKKNEYLSEIPCLKIDSDKKTITGECFSSSMCDRWSEQYKITNNSLSLVVSKGTYCDPATGDAYSYIEKYENGKLIEKTVEPLAVEK
jgi:hypothetical protein